MLRNYIKIAWRNLQKSKMFSLINILGLTIGMTCCLLIYMYVNHELSYDNFHSKGDQIYRLGTDVITPTETIKADITSAPMGPNLKSDFPEVLEMTRLWGTDMLLNIGERTFQEDNVIIADASLFKVFSFPLLKGNEETALKDPFSLVLTESQAQKYFGSEDPIGKQLLVEGQYDAKVTGVVADVPSNSHFDFDLLVSMTSMEYFRENFEEQWGNFGCLTYLVLPPDHNYEELVEKMPAFMEKHIGEDMAEDEMRYNLVLEPLSDVYLRSDREYSSSGGNQENVFIFSFIALFILLIACINFMNLSTARSADRAKEVGTRKTVGAGRWQLISQFLGESILICLLAFILALLLTALLLPVFNQLSGKAIALSMIANAGSILLFLVLALAIGFLSGLYPAFILTRFKPSEVLKGKFGTSNKGLALRRVLVVMQFAIAVVLIGGTAVILTQLNYMRNQELGFNKEQMLVIDFRSDEAVLGKFETIKKELARISNVQSISGSSSLPSVGNSSAYTQIENREGDMQASNINLYSVDFDFLDQYDLEVVAGRTFSADFATDSTQAMLVNQATVKSLGFTSDQEALGKKFSQWGREGEIVGVIKDFHYRSLAQNIAPLSFRIAPDDFGVFSLNVATNNIQQTVSQIEEAWQGLAPQRPFEYFFLDQAFDEQYAEESRFGRLFLYFAILAIFIACLGLLGLVSHTNQTRTKEIGIRKVLGSSVSGIIMLLSKDLFKLSLIAVVIATPIAYYGMDRWLENFAYRIEVPWWVLALSAVLAILIAFLSVSYQSIKAALTNPIESLKYE